MAELINFNKAKKVRAKSEAQATAAEHRTKFGLTKAQRLALRLDAARVRRELEGKKRDK